MRPKVARVLGVALVLVALAGCRPSSPSPSGFDSSAQQAVTDMSSEVATARLTAQQLLRDRFFGSYAPVVLTYSEEAAQKAQQAVSSLQPPPSRQDSYDLLTQQLSDAADQVTTTRIAIVDDDRPRIRRQVEQLTHTLRVLDRLETRLSARTGTP